MLAPRSISRKEAAKRYTIFKTRTRRDKTCTKPSGFKTVPTEEDPKAKGNPMHGASGTGWSKA